MAVTFTATAASAASICRHDPRRGEALPRVRGGESLFPEGTVHTYARENTAGYFKNGFVPFVPVEYL